MSTNSLILRPRTMSGLQASLRLLGLLVIFAVGGALMFLNYWAGVGFLLVALPLLIWFGLKEYQGRNLALLLYAHLAVVLVVSGLLYPILIDNPGVRRLAQDNAVANVFLATFEMTALTSFLIGLIAAFFVVTLPFLLIVAVASVVILRSHQGEDVSFFRVYLYLLYSFLAIGPMVITVEGREIKGRERDKERLEIYGGPAWLIVCAGQMVVLHRRGEITRAVGLGTTILEREEKIKTILPVGPQGNTQVIKNVLTRDRISLTLTVLHAAMVETASDTKARLEEDVAEAKKEKNRLEALRRSLPGEIKTAEQRLAEAKKQLHLFKRETPGQTRTRLEEAAAEADRAYQEQLDPAERSSPEDISAAEQHLKAAEAQWEYLRTETEPETKARLEKDVAQAEAHLQELKETGDSLESDLEAAQQDIAAAENKLEELENEDTVGDEFFQSYESIAKLAGARAADVWGSVKFFVANNAKDVFMSEKSEDLFTINTENGDLVTKVNQRKIQEIEKYIFDTTFGRGTGKGVKLLIIDIGEIHYPDELKEKLEEEVKTQVEERIEKTKALIEESKAKAKIIEARANSQAKILEGQGEGEARAAVFREILRELKREELLTQDEISSAVLKLISTTISVKELEHFFKATTMLRRQERHMMTGPDEVNGAGGE